MGCSKQNCPDFADLTLEWTFLWKKSGITSSLTWSCCYPETSTPLLELKFKALDLSQFLNWSLYLNGRPLTDRSRVTKSHDASHPKYLGLPVAMIIMITQGIATWIAWLAPSRPTPSLCISVDHRALPVMARWLLYSGLPGLSQAARCHEARGEHDRGMSHWPWGKHRGRPRMAGWGLAWWMSWTCLELCWTIYRRKFGS